MRVRVNDRNLTYAARLDVTLTLTSVSHGNDRANRYLFPFTCNTLLYTKPPPGMPRRWTDLDSVRTVLLPTIARPDGPMFLRMNTDSLKASGE